MSRPALTAVRPSDRTVAAVAYSRALYEASRALESAPAGDRRAYRRFQAAMYRAREILALDRRRN